MHDLRPMIETPGPEFRRGPEGINESQASLILGSYFAAVGFTDEIIMGEMAIAVVEYFAGCCVHEIEGIEGFKDDDEGGGFNDARGG